MDVSEIIFAFNVGRISHLSIFFQTRHMVSITMSSIMFMHVELMAKDFKIHQACQCYINET